MSDKRAERLLYAAAPIIPVVWLALLVAPCIGGSAAAVFERLTEAIKQPFHIVWCAYSGKCILVLLALYFCGVLFYFGTRPNTRDGEEHGSAKWGVPKEINKSSALT